MHSPKHSFSGRGRSFQIDDIIVRDSPATIPVIVFCYSRAAVLKETLTTLFRVRPLHFPRGSSSSSSDPTTATTSSSLPYRIFISQDGSDFPEVTEVIREFQKRHPDLIHLVHERDETGVKPEEANNHWEAYYAISHHYRWALSQVMRVSLYQHVILLEEDLQVGVDFFGYMRAASVVLDSDPSLFCVSAWNDNGKADRVVDPYQIYRSDFFPGLGWLISRRFWVEVQDVWPRGFWDDWLRQPGQRKGRACLRPEVPRTRSPCQNGDGVSGGQFCEHLAAMKLADVDIQWDQIDLSYLRKDRYDAMLGKWLAVGTRISTPGELEQFMPRRNGDRKRKSGTSTTPFGPAAEIVLPYSSNDELVTFADQLNLMSDFKDNVPRTAYQGTVTFRYGPVRVHLAATTHLYD